MVPENPCGSWTGERESFQSVLFRFGWELRNTAALSWGDGNALLIWQGVGERACLADS